MIFLYIHLWTKCNNYYIVITFRWTCYYIFLHLLLHFAAVLHFAASAVNFADNEFKRPQFAYNTILMLDGSLGFLQAALNVLEIIGTMSGLKMNTNKTELVWIGRKRYSRDKLNMSTNLEWGNTSFVLLGTNHLFCRYPFTTPGFDQDQLDSIFHL